MSEKSIEQRIGFYFLFGETEDGRVDLGDGKDDTLFTGLDKDIANKIIEAHDRFRLEVYKIFGIIKEEDLKDG